MSHFILDVIVPRKGILIKHKIKKASNVHRLFNFTCLFCSARVKNCSISQVRLSQNKTSQKHSSCGEVYLFRILVLETDIGFH